MANVSVKCNNSTVELLGLDKPAPLYFYLGRTGWERHKIELVQYTFQIEKKKVLT